MFYIMKQDDNSFEVYNDGWGKDDFVAVPNVKLDMMDKNMPLVINDSIIIQDTDGLWYFMDEDKNVSSNGFSWIEDFLVSGYYPCIRVKLKGSDETRYIDIANRVHAKNSQNIYTLYDYYIGKLKLENLPDGFFSSKKYIEFLKTTEVDRFYEKITKEYGDIEYIPEDIWQSELADARKKAEYIDDMAEKFCHEYYSEEIGNNRINYINAMFGLADE